MVMILAQAAEAVTAEPDSIPAWLVVFAIALIACVAAAANNNQAQPPGVQPMVPDPNALVRPEFDAIAPPATENQRPSLRVHVEIDEVIVRLPSPRSPLH